MAGKKEREYKFILTEDQYSSLWNQVQPVSKQELQDNLFFDHQSILGNLLWAFRLRLEGPPASAVTGADAVKSLHDIDFHTERAVMAVKGPAQMSKGAVLRSEVEEQVPLAAARRIVDAGRVAFGEMPPAVAAAVKQILKDCRPPEEFDVWASFRNLRLANFVKTAHGSVETALDRSETADGRRRFELEIETTGDGDILARGMMQKMGTNSFETAKVGKLVWAAQLDTRAGTL
jgi:hypothetical protein